MPNYFVVALALAVSSVGLAQSPVQSSGSGVKHYRLTFVIDSGQGGTGKQSLMLDVPVTAEKMGAARAELTSGDNTQSAVQQVLECRNVHASAKGLELHISLQSDREAPIIPGIVSARHQHGEFQRTVDLQIGKPTMVTGEMQFRALGNTDPALAERLKQPAPTITVTAEAL